MTLRPPPKSPPQSTTSNQPEGFLSRQLSNEAFAELEIAERAAPTADIGSPPDGGVRAWSVICSSSLVLFCVFGFVTSMGQLEAYYLVNQLAGYSKATVAWIASVQSMLVYLGSVFVGRRFDSHGPRQLIWVGTLLLTGSLVAVAFCHKYYQFLLAHMLFGIGGTIVYAPSTSITAHWFARRRGTAVAVVVTGAGAGGIIYPIMMKKLLDKLSFRDTMLIVAFFTMAMMLPSCLFLRARLPPRKPPPLSALGGPWHEVKYACLVVGAAFFLMNVFVPYFDAIYYAEINGVAPHVVEYAVAIMQAGSFAGRAIAGPLADKFGVWTVYGRATYSSAIVVLALWTGATGAGTAIAGLILFGVGTGAWMTLVTAATAAISPVTEVGMRIGMLWAAGALPNLVGPVICGVLISADDGKFTYAGVFIGLTLFLGSAIITAPALWSFITDRKR